MSTTPLTVIKPFAMSDANVVSISVTEDDYAVWSSGSTYAANDRVIMTAGVHKAYQSLIGSNAGNDPSLDDGTNWAEVGPTTAWAAFDEYASTICSNASDIEFQFTGDRIDSIAFLGLQATSVRIEASAAGEGTYFDQTFTLPDSSPVLDWYDYFYSVIERQRDLVVFGIPPIDGSTYTVTIIGSGTRQVATMVAGQRRQIGFVEYGASADIISYGRSEVDEFGKRKRVRRGYARRLALNVEVDKAATDALFRYLADLRETPVLWVGAAEYLQTLTVFGEYTSAKTLITYPNKHYISLQIDGYV